MQSVFVVGHLLQHLHVLAEGEEDAKFIGVCTAHENARRAFERPRLAPGFRDFPVLVADLGEGPDEGSGFYLKEHRLDSDGRESGFESV